MTTSEIRELLAQSKEWRDDNFDFPYFLPGMEHAIETLLARQAEVVEYLEKSHPRTHLARHIRAILEPEKKP